MGQGNMDFHIPGTRRSQGSGTVIEFQGKSVGDIKKSFASACKTADLKDVTPHTLRHTAITWLVQKGVSLWEVSGYVGVSTDTIERVYGHHAPDYLENARKAME
jgi:integrase